VNILLVSSIAPRGIYGSSRLLRETVEYLTMRGHRVEVLTYAADGEERVPIDAAHAYVVYGIASRRLPGISSLAMWARLVRLSLTRRYDLVLCGVAYPSAILAGAARVVTHCPYAVYSHGEDVTQVGGARLKTALLARALRGARLIMANSTFTRQRIAALGIPAGKIALVHPWVDPSRFATVSSGIVDSLRARLGLDGAHVVLTVAHLDARKGQDTVIRALGAVRQRIPTVRYVIAGKGDQARLRALAAAEGVDNLVVFANYLSDDELAALYHLSQVYVMVSRWDPVTRYVEGFGIVYLEAAAAGLPAIAGSAGGCPDAVADGATGLLVDPTSVRETAEALCALLIDRERAAALGEAGRRRVEASFTKETQLEYLAGLVTAAIAQGRTEP